MDAHRLADALTQAVSEPRMQKDAAALGQKIRDEDGVKTAVALIDHFRDSYLS